MLRILGGLRGFERRGFGRPQGVSGDFRWFHKSFRGSRVILRGLFGFRDLRSFQEIPWGLPDESIQEVYKGFKEISGGSSGVSEGLRGVSRGLMQLVLHLTISLFIT